MYGEFIFEPLVDSPRLTFHVDIFRCRGFFRRKEREWHMNLNSGILRSFTSLAEKTAGKRERLFCLPKPARPTLTSRHI